MCIVFSSTNTVSEATDTIAYKVVRITDGCRYISQWENRERAPQEVSSHYDIDSFPPRIKFVKYERWHTTSPGTVVEYKIGEDKTDDVGLGYYLYTQRTAAFDICWEGGRRAVLQVRIPAGTKMYIGQLNGAHCIISPRIIVEKVLVTSVMLYSLQSRGFR